MLSNYFKIAWRNIIGNPIEPRQPVGNAKCGGNGEAAGKGGLPHHRRSPVAGDRAGTDV